MRSRSQTTPATRGDVAPLVRDPGRVTITDVPRPRRAPTTGPEADALDEARRTFDRIEAQLEKQRDVLKAAIVRAVRGGDMPKAEAGRRSGYSREYVTALVKAAEEQRAAES